MFKLVEELWLEDTASYWKMLWMNCEKKAELHEEYKATILNKPANFQGNSWKKSYHELLHTWMVKQSIIKHRKDFELAQSE